VKGQGYEVRGELVGGRVALEVGSDEGDSLYATC